MTALMKAAAGGHTHVCTALTAMGADVNARGHGGMTALMFAVSPKTSETNPQQETLRNEQETL